MKQLFTNPETHPVIHTHKTAMYSLSEQDYMMHTQILLNCVRVDGSAESILVTFPSLSLNNETTLLHPQALMQLPMQPLTHQCQQFASLQHGFLNPQPHPLLYHYSHPADIKPHNTSNVPLVGMHLCKTTGDPHALPITDAEMHRHFEDLQHFHQHRAD